MSKSDKQVTILVVDDEQVHRFMLSSMLKEWGWRCVEADDGLTAVEAVKKNTYNAVLMDVRMARMNGHEAFRKIHEIQPALPVIIMTAYSSVDDAVEAIIKHGAHDYLTKPLDFDRLRLSLDRALDHRQVEEKKLEAAGDASELVSSIIGCAPPMMELLEMIRYVAPTEATVLVAGESGTGKELVAESLHRNSERRDGPFVKVNCAALAESLLESELFGHEKGAFTGADRKRDGKFVQADGGTLFLDEIGETSQAMQVKLLRVLQEQELQLVGGEETVKVDVRIIAATNRDLEEDVRAGRFREDLYYRLAAVTLHLPALRERPADIPLIAAGLLARAQVQMNGKARGSFSGFSDAAQACLAAYRWPGNVRELNNEILRMLALGEGQWLGPELLSARVLRAASGAQEERELSLLAGLDGGLKERMEQLEARIVKEVLIRHRWNKTQAAAELGLSRVGLRSKLARYGLDPS